jgi:hypothetical protein
MLFTMDGCMCINANVCICILGMDGENPCKMNIYGVHTLRKGFRPLYDDRLSTWSQKGL